MPEALSIKKSDSRFPDWLNFAELRKEGLDHIAKLSGDLWTDHNLHDPGITIMEVLIYALTDLGYRSRLDIKDLFAKSKNDPTSEDNFYTAAEILTCNPLTILDYRKLLIDIDGVRNAWLIPASEQEVKLYFDCRENGSLTYTRPAIQPVKCVKTDSLGNETTYEATIDDYELKLRGLYNVYLDIDPVRPKDQARGMGKSDELPTGRILTEVRNRLHLHRNLCEDFLNISILQDEQISICADIELTENAAVNETLANIYAELQQLVSPNVTFYSLGQMIKKEKSLEDIFLGRPMVRESHGFIDVEELKKLEIPTELHASDFYQAIMRAVGVRAVRNLVLVNMIDGIPQTTGAEWCLQLTANHRPIFSPEHSNFNFFKNTLQFKAQKEIVIQQFKQRLSDFSKALLKDADLDLSVPGGNYREDLADYLSIQHEFPLVYGIGEGGLPENASNERKVQALQLKSYLTFFDQVLADYLAQLSHIRDLFSWSVDHTNGRDIARQKTYFSNSLNNIPEIEKLIRFFQSGMEKKENIEEGDTLAFSLVSYDNQVERDIAVQQLIDDFSRQEKELELIVRKVEDQDKYHFVFRNQRGNKVERLISSNVYTTQRSAQLAGEMLYFLGTLASSYTNLNFQEEHRYTFSFIYNPVDYLDYLQTITESRNNYLQRRERFLNHLLARFGEEFTEYVLLMFALDEGKKDLEEVVEDKSRFLSQYADISRNRGRAFNYLDQDQIWNTDNVSGVEKRVSGLMGLNDWSRRNLNNFQVIQREEGYLFRVLDHRGHALFFGAQAYPDKVTAGLAYQQLINWLGQEINELGLSFQDLDCPEESVFGFKIVLPHGKDFAFHPRTYSNQKDRDDARACLQAYFAGLSGLTTSLQSGKEGYYFSLFDENGEELIFESKLAYADEKEALLAWHEFILLARDKDLYTDHDDPFADRFSFTIGDLAIHPQYYNSRKDRDIAKERVHDFIVSKDVFYRIEQLANTFSWSINDTEGKLLLESAHRFKSPDQSISAWYRVMDWLDLTAHIKAEEEGGLYRFVIYDPYERIIARSRDYPSDEERAQKQAETEHFIAIFQQKRGPVVPVEKAFHYELQDAQGSPLVRSTALFPDRTRAQAAFKNLIADAANLHGEILKTEGFNEFRIQLLDVSGVLLAQSIGPYASKDEADQALILIMDILQSEEPAFASYELREAYQFVISSFGSGEPLLQSYQCYASEEKTYVAYLEALLEGQQPENYSITRSSGHYSFRLQNSRRRIIAVSSIQFEEEQACREAIDRTLNIIIRIRSKVNPICYTGYLIVSIKDESGEIALHGEKQFGKEPEAIGHLYELIDLGCDPTHYVMERSEDGCWYTFRLEDNFEVAARHLVYYPEKKAERVRDEIIKYILDNKYNYLIALRKGKWKYQVHWEACNGRCEVLLQEEDEHNTEPEARKAMDDLIALLHERGASDYFYPTVNDKGQYSFAVVGDRPELIIASHPFPYDSAEERDKIMADAAAYFDFFFYVQRTGDFSFIAEDSTTPLPEGTLSGHIVPALEICGDCNESEDASDNPDTALNTYYSGFKVAKEEEFIALHPHRYNCEADRAAAQEALMTLGECRAYEWTMICFRGNKIIQEEEKRFYFKIVDSEDHEVVLFRSVDRYESRAIATAAFLEQWSLILSNAKQRSRYRWENTEDPISLEDGQGKVLAVVPERFDSRFRIKEAIDRRVSYARQHVLIRQGDQYLYRLWNEEKRQHDWESSASYADVQEAAAAFEHFLELLRYPVNYLKTGTNSACIFEIKLVDTLLVSRETYLDCYRGEDIPQDIVDCPEAWNGVKSFLIHAHEDYAVYPYSRYADDCRYSFRMVDDRYRLAVHVRQYHTMAEREQALDWLYAQVQCQLKKWTDVEADVCTLIGQAYYLMKKSVTDDTGLTEEPAGTGHLDEDILWRSYASFGTAGNALAAYETDYLEIIEHAREIDYYQLILEEGYYRVALSSDDGRILAVTPCKYKQPADRKQAIMERIIHARLFPVFKAETGFGFRCYSLDAIPLGQETKPAGDCPPVPSNPFDLDIPGEIIWESARTYKTEEEARCAFDELVRLGREKSNYQRTEAAACGPFGVELTRPENVLAEHPSSYCSRSDLEKAIERTRACFNVEGFHLVEHILLRPTVGVGEEYRVFFTDKDEYVYQFSNLVFNEKGKAEEFKGQVIDKMLLELNKALPQVGIPTNYNPKNRWLGLVQSLPYELVRKNLGDLLLDLDISFGLQGVISLRNQLHERLFVQGTRDGIEPDWLAPACPDCCHAVEIVDEQADSFCDTSPCADMEEVAQENVLSVLRGGVKTLDSNGKDNVSWYVPGADPYSFWASIVVPYWPKRFQNLNFRQFFQNTLRREVPAHIGLRICWLDPKQMREFEVAYRAWLTAISGRLECDLQETKCEMIEKLYGMKNVYPPGQIHESVCDEDDRNTIFLDKSQLA
ncbi:MAG: hypothetical protein R2824_18860 [Saprospiraceae bacterium]|nr:hypothetical protein [Lewinella sp.]